MKRLSAAFAAALLAAAARAQMPCPTPDDLTPQQLLGVWTAQLQGEWGDATLRLERNPEYAGSFRGTLERDNGRWQVAGDWDEGEFTLEESADGKHIAAAWEGEVVPGSCGREIRGTWTRDGEATGRNFVLRKQGK
jgi:hypothetical protein